MGFLLLWACLGSAHSRGCSSFFCRKSHRVSGMNGVDPGAPLFLTPYIEKGAIDEGMHPHLTEFSHNTTLSKFHCYSFIMIILTSCLFVSLAARKLSLVGDLPGANVKSYAGYLTVNKKYNSNLYFWFFPALKVGSDFFCPSYTLLSMLQFGRGSRHFEMKRHVCACFLWNLIVLQVFFTQIRSCTCVYLVCSSVGMSAVTFLC